MPKQRLFISHISEEMMSAAALKAALSRDFLGLPEVFVSSDEESIAAGDDWLSAIRNALGQCSALIILCSRASIERPWINFEAGAAWMRNVPLIPVCHLELRPRDLPIPLSLRQAIALNRSEDIKRLYQRVADVLHCDLPSVDFAKLSTELNVARDHGTPTQSVEVTNNRELEVRRLLRSSLEEPEFAWRTLQRVAISAGTSEEYAADLLRSDPAFRFSKSKTGNVIVGLRSRVGN